jgi:nucleotide-binding universal stress UspA family protein
MIVMGTHHRRWLHLHDVAAATVQRAHVPVMVVQA